VETGSSIARVLTVAGESDEIEADEKFDCFES